jgi:hypothetical protein
MMMIRINLINRNKKLQKKQKTKNEINTDFKTR